MRLDKLIADSTDYSRTDAKRLIKQGVITVNETIIKSPQYQVNTQDKVTFNNKILATPAPRYFMFHKPMGVVCANADSEHPIVNDYFDVPNRYQLQMAGRLDKDTTGLVLVTDDGQWNHRLTSPNNHCFKYYQVTVANPLSPTLIDIFHEGILLKQEDKKTRPARLTILNDYKADLAIQEGKYHQVKRMFAAIGNHVMALHRYRIGNIVLDSSLQPGEYRTLNDEEVTSIDRP